MYRNRFGALVLVLGLVFVNSAHAQGSGTKAPAGSETKKADFRVQTLDGRWVSFSETVKGKPALLIFWASWCPVCREQTATFQEAFDRTKKKDFRVMAINIGMKETLASAKQYATEKHLTLPLYFDGDHSVTKVFNVASTPTILLLDRNGKVVSKGDEIDFDAIDALIAGKPIPRKEARPAPAGSGSTGR
jgi:peroxiredoxin